MCNGRGLATYSTQCPAGFYCPDPSRPDIQTGCPAGSFCPQGSLNPTKCASGTYQPYMYQATCLDCPLGFVCSQTDTSFALVCPQGMYCPAKTETPKPCPIGTYNPVWGLSTLTQCFSCLEGYYCASVGLAAPSGKCAAGYFCKSGATTATPAVGPKSGPCNPGYYCPEGTPIQVPCPVGTSSDTALNTGVA